MRPNLIIIGATKCGTSSLHHYLARHPQIFMSKPKELRFFTKHWNKGVAWYESHFGVDTPIRGESSPQYTVYPKNAGVPARMHSVVPDARLIYMVRDPVERVVADYLERLGQFREHRELESILANFESCIHAQRQYINPSRYWFQIDQYLEFYPAKQILVVALEDLRTRRADTLRHIFRFLHVDETFRDQAFDRVWNDSTSKRRMSSFGRIVYPNRLRQALHHEWVPYPITRVFKALVHATGKPVERPRLSADLERRLADCFRDDVSRLRGFTGATFPDWRAY
jgi:hypothetical protein